MNSSDIVDQLKSEGFLYLKDIKFEEFEKLICDFSKITWITDVKFHAKTNSFPFKTDSVLYHTDYPFANYIAWYCFSPCSKGGGISQLKDMRKILKLLTTEELEILSSVTFLIEKFDFTLYSIPFNLSYDDYRKYYYQPYRFKYSCYSKIQEQIISKFDKLIAASETIHINLCKGDCL